ncbi:MAG TPA: right-handed parallel beta-helix repeat-containing protein [Burkholderiales bacterium]|nr:right-handed parallel beta-helix repeat-containing protein [Burkholderiales bacterium]
MRNLIIVAFVALTNASAGQAATLPVDCDAGEKLQDKVRAAKPGDEIMVSGTCNESIAIASEVTRITLNGQGKATIQAPAMVPKAAPTFPFFIRGKEITIKGFTLNGGFDGVHLSGAAAGASAIIDNNIILGARRFGIHLDSGSVGHIANNRIENVGAAGIEVTEHSVARIGFLIPAFPQLGPNTIRNAGADGIVVSRGSSAWIVGNTISANKGSGVSVSRDSQADILGNLIAGNGADGITARYGAAINFSSEDTSRHEGPNSTGGGEKNAGVGIRCMVGGYVAGPLGTLAGVKGVKDIDATCIDKTLQP